MKAVARFPSTTHSYVQNLLDTFDRANGIHQKHIRKAETQRNYEDSFFFQVGDESF